MSLLNFKKADTRLKFVGVCFFLLFFVGCQAAPPPEQADADTPDVVALQTPEIIPEPIQKDWLTVNSPTPSIQVFGWWWHTHYFRDLDLVNEMGFSWVKQRFAWREIEVEQGQYNWDVADYIVDTAELKGIQMIALVDYPPLWLMQNPEAENGPPIDFAEYGRFCHDLAAKYKGRIRAYQVWNEPNLAREWGDQPPQPREYAKLLQACYLGIKDADPDAIVISAPLAPTGTESALAMPDEKYLVEVYKAGAQPYFDMLGLNAPGYKAPPTVSSAEIAADPNLGGHRWAGFRHVEDMRNIQLIYDDPAKQIAILEMGWTSDPVNQDYRWFRVSEEQKAENLVNAYLWANENWQPWIGFMNMIYIADPDWSRTDEEFWWAITDGAYPEAELRPAYYALQAMTLE